MQELERDHYSLEEWMDLLDAELQAKRPVLYSGSSSTVGHQFVCDGSDGDGLYHINWGWGGYQDGYLISPSSIPTREALDRVPMPTDILKDAVRS